MLTELLELYAYNRWAHGRTLAAVAGLSAEQYAEPVGGSFPSLKATLEHLFAAESRWLDRWRGDPFGRIPDFADCPDVAALGRRWEALWDDQGRFLAELSEETLARRLHARFSDGTEVRQPLAEMMRHVVNHATYHRGQVATFVRKLGGTPAGTDYITYCMLRDDGKLPSAATGAARAGAA